MRAVLREGVRTLRREGPRVLARSVGKFARYRRQELENVLGHVRRTLAYRYRYGSSAPRAFRLIHVDPSDVDALVVPRFQQRVSNWGTHVRGGDWDVADAGEELTYAAEFEAVGGEPARLDFEDYTFYRSLRAHFQRGVPWEETELYRWFVERDHGDVRYATAADVSERFAYLDDLYDRMATDGYRRQAELSASGSEFDLKPPAYHEVLVDVGRDGEILFDDGRHRFCIAKVLGLDSVPVRVLVRHEEWQTTRRAVADGTDPTDPSVDAPPSHPDLQDL